MDKFKIRKMTDTVTEITGADRDSFYLVEGEEYAAVIDTGVSPGTEITPFLRTLTRKPLILLLTHAHIDHIHHMDEFESVYMCHDELQMDPEFLRQMMGGKDLDLVSTTHVSTGDVIDLGGRILEVCQVYGHTPGSVVFYDKKEDLLFSGDAFGSGCGVWMQLGCSSDLEIYRRSLTEFIRWAVQKSPTMTILGGHYHQRWESRAHPGDNPMTLGVVADLLSLTDKIIKGEIQGKPLQMEERLAPNGALRAAFGRAEMLYKANY